MTHIACFDAACRPLSPTEAAAMLGVLGVETGTLPAPLRPVSSAPQLTHARELRALQLRFSTVLTDRMQLPPAPDPAASGRSGGRPRTVPAAVGAAAEPAQLHTHGDREIRIVVAGQAAFLLQAPAGWATVRCDERDWIALPPGLPHRCLASPRGGADLLRLFAVPYGWKPHPVDGCEPDGLTVWPSAESVPVMGATAVAVVRGVLSPAS